MNKEESFTEKKLRGSGGYTIAKINDNEQKMANLGGPELFLAGVGRIENDRFIKYYCNKCEKGYEGAPNIHYENPNEDLGENIILVEKGEYKCKLCNYTIAQYRKFNDTKEDNVNSQDSNGIEEKTDINEEPLKKSDQDIQEMRMKSAYNKSTISNLEEVEYSPIEKIVGMSTYNNNAQLVGKISEIGLRKISEGKVQFSFKITNSKKEIMEVTWDDIDKIGDIMILHEKVYDANLQSSKDKKDTTSKITDKNQNSKICTNCNYKNDLDAMFCEECGKKLAE
jgi:sporulation protein YlmC with PRC-barrel domain/ribosomal protein L40E